MTKEQETHLTLHEHDDDDDDKIYNYQSKHNKIYCTVLYNMLHNYMFRPLF